MEHPVYRSPAEHEPGGIPDGRASLQGHSGAGGAYHRTRKGSEEPFTTVFDGELDATDVFVSLIAQKHTRKIDKEYLAKTQEMRYNKDEVHSDRVPSGLCG